MFPWNFSYSDLKDTVYMVDFDRVWALDKNFTSYSVRVQVCERVALRSITQHKHPDISVTQSWTKMDSLF
jgi:hypothetical protein